MRTRVTTTVLALLLVFALFVPAASAAPRAPRMAKADGIQLYVPSRKAVAVGFHQANSRSSLDMRTMTGRTMSSRHRGTGRATAVDVQVWNNTGVRAPVTGRVVSVTPYRLYGTYRDIIIQIAPKGHPNKRVVVLHTAYRKVEAGDWVRGGRTLIAKRARQLPFGSQIDWYSGKRLPHVHVEVRPA